MPGALVFWVAAAAVGLQYFQVSFCLEMRHTPSSWAVVSRVKDSTLVVALRCLGCLRLSTLARELEGWEAGTVGLGVSWPEGLVPVVAVQAGAAAI